eukprot:67649_1
MTTLVSFNEEFSNTPTLQPLSLICGYTRQHLCQKISSKINKIVTNFYGTSFFFGTKGWKFFPPMEILHKKDKIVKYYYYQNIVMDLARCESHPLEHKSFEELRFGDQQNVHYNSDEAKSESLDNDESDNSQNDNEEKEGNLKGLYGVVINGYVQEFQLSELIGIQYFSNCLSNRWNHCTDNKKQEIKIDPDSKHTFDLEELEVIIKCKRYQKVDTTYHISRLQQLLNALDYFQETIDNNIFYQYLLSYPNTV